MASDLSTTEATEATDITKPAVTLKPCLVESSSGVLLWAGVASVNGSAVELFGSPPARPCCC